MIDSSQPRFEGRIPIAPGVFVSPSGLRMQFSRAGGPGGQNVNKLNTRAELWVRLDAISGLSNRALARLRAAAGTRLTDAGEIHLVSQSRRSQQANRQEVLDRLRQLVLAARHEPKPRHKTRPTRSAIQRRMQAKRRRGQLKIERRGVEPQQC
ncbi:alternative ribosome rescue aminoacyl-tRNA hydrolase ArfB [Fontivita pretiosa]|uniref:alternative ribosome rescue aminoacyl-tRNA hydrolase ArfB n=1 Tax=Fontivita pretiosa TaxID=2989684 RepID=UPI003D18577A